MDAASLPLPATEACDAAVSVVRSLRATGHQAFFVGGCVRDLVLGLTPKDYDVATSAAPPAVVALFRHVVEVGVAFGVVRVRVPGRSGGPLHEIEVATFRADGGYSDGRRPDAVRFTDVREDVLRRDFTLNGLLLDPLGPDGRPVARSQVVDLVGGLDDLHAGILRAIGVPRLRFAEDALRMLRAPRFAARFVLEIEPATATAIRTAAADLVRVSPERVRAELLAMLAATTAPRALALLEDLGLAQVLWPALVAADPGLRSRRSRFAALHPELPGQAPTPGRDRVPPLPADPSGLPPEAGVAPPLAIAALWWPLWTGPATALAEAWRLSRAETASLAAILRLAKGLHAAAADLALRTPPDQTETAAAAWPEPALVRPLRDPNADAALRLLLADDEAMGVRGAVATFLHGWRQLRVDVPYTQWWPQPVVTGDDLQAWGHAPGPGFRAALVAAEDAQLSGRSDEEAAAAARSVLAGGQALPKAT